MTRLKYLLIIITVLTVTVCVAYVKNGLKQIIHVEHEQEFVVEQGTSAIQLLNLMHQQGLIQHVTPIKILFKFDKRFAQIKRGTYSLEPEQSFMRFWQRLMTGDELNFQMTFVEGQTWRQWYAQMASHPKLVMDIDEPTLLKTLSIENFEGLLLPETYIFRDGMKASVLIKKAYTDMDSFLQQQWQRRSPEVQLSSSYEALIMASIIEKETAINDEMPIISGVFTNRLKQNMRLQTDPTVIYGIGEQFDGNITRQHLRQYTPYNTYRIDGLPPTPIAMPSKRAIIAALNPQPTEALFFVAKGDGSHYFSATLAEHNAAVRRYQLGQESN